MLSLLRSGIWLSEARIRAYCVILIAGSVFGVLLIAFRLHGFLDPTGQPPGSDFSQVWVAGRSVISGHPEVPFDPHLHAQAQALAFGLKGIFYGWHYPPYFLAVAALFALLPYTVSLACWQISTLMLYMAAMRRVLPGMLPMLAALAFPAVFVNLEHGQNGFLTAALMVSALLCLPRHELLAGVLFALLAYKPQFGVAVPVALMMAWRWRTICSATLTLFAMTALTVAAFGVGVWTAFSQSWAFTRSVVLEQGSTGWFKIQSIFAAIRMWGGSIAVAYGCQLALSIAVLVALALVWRRKVDCRLQSAALLTAALLTTPYSLDYDLVLLGPAIAFTVAHGLDHGFLPWEKTALAAVWTAPLLTRIVAEHTMLPVGFAATLGVFGLVCCRAVGAYSVSGTFSPAASPVIAGEPTRA